MAGFKFISGLIESLPALERVAFHVANVFGQRERFRVRINGRDSIHLVLFFGVVKYSSGPQIEIDLQCTPGALAVVHRSLMKKSVQMQSRLVA